MRQPETGGVAERVPGPALRIVAPGKADHEVAAVDHPPVPGVEGVRPRPSGAQFDDTGRPGPEGTTRVPVTVIARDMPPPQ
ncbi:hypothetical protein PSA01_37790 [Pseudonocardia saturnea]|uniref:Uncharacterized protein n=1 Tax=Pseudonocardia saturnea TaxID=33909 RepID=A0ABQ0S1G1_9PSEU|nr:hypothetical protein Pdca_13900 [Pseudonocardia autotrophica]GEC26750.1 hypothetical protein PSA01_37790 [Pseudonocardia saturnea]